MEVFFAFFSGNRDLDYRRPLVNLKELVEENTFHIYSPIKFLLCPELDLVKTCTPPQSKSLSREVVWVDLTGKDPDSGLVFCTTYAPTPKYMVGIVKTQKIDKNFFDILTH